MSNITGEFVEFVPSVSIKSQKGTMYDAYKLVYKDSTGKYNEIAKPKGSLDHAPAFKNGLENLKAGDMFVLEREQNGNFLNPVKIYKVDGNVAPPASAPKQAPVQQNSTGPNTFEVNNQLKEKQMKFDVERQPIYVRQTALKAASELAEVLKLKTEQAVLDQAKRFVRFIETGDSGSIEEMVNDDIDIS